MTGEHEQTGRRTLRAPESLTVHHECKSACRGIVTTLPLLYLPEISDHGKKHYTLTLRVAEIQGRLIEERWEECYRLDALIRCDEVRSHFDEEKLKMGSVPFDLASEAVKKD